MAGGGTARLVADDDDGGEPVERVRIDAGQDRQEVDAAEARRAGQHLGARAADDVGDLDRAKARVDRDGDGAEPRAGEIEDRIGRHVGQPQRHAIARADAEIGEALRRAQRLLVQFREGDRPFAVQERGRIRRLLREVREQGPDIRSRQGERHGARRLEHRPLTLKAAKSLWITALRKEAPWPLAPPRRMSLPEDRARPLPIIGVRWRDGAESRA